MSSESESADPPPSKLGTKEHWDDVYSSELANFEEIGDEGEIWFGEDSVEKMVTWACAHVPPEEPHPFVLEVGAGNGNLLFALAAVGYAPARLCGIDYSADAVHLARAIARTRAAEGVGADTQDITFNACDFLVEDVPALPGMPPPAGDAPTALWDLVLDKGTFDAIALAEKRPDGSALADDYPARIARAVRPGGHFLITSCNFTEEELTVKFASNDTRLVYHSRMPFPRFSFGGKTGNVYSSVAFEKQPCIPIGAM